MKRLITWIVIVLVPLGLYAYFGDGFKEREDVKPSTESKPIQEPIEESLPETSETEVTQPPSDVETEKPKESFQAVEAFLPPVVKGRIIVPKVDPFKAAYIKEPIILLQHSHFKLDPNYLPKSGEYFYLQVKNSLSAEGKQVLKQLGVSLLEYIPHKTWIISVKDPKNLFQLKVLANIYAIGEIDPRDKLEENLLKGKFYSYAVDGKKGVVEVVVHFRKPNERKETMKLSPQEISKLVMQPDVYWIEQKPPPPALYNQTGAALSHSDQLAASKLTGKGVVIGIWDGDFLEPHLEIGNRIIESEEDEIIVKDGKESNPMNLAHAMHVAGTLIGNGSLNPRARGMANEAKLYSEDFNGDRMAELKAAIQKHKIAISNHSYGMAPIGWDKDLLGTWRFVDNQSLFGQYSAESAKVDKLIVDEKYHVLVKAAGNEGDDIGDGSHPPDGRFNNIPGDGSVAKNVITVGSVDNEGSVSPFSSWGPTKDSRIKPDIVAKGQDIVSTYSPKAPCPLEPLIPPSNKLHCSLSGTSMATPVVAGTLALLIERYKQDKQFYKKNPSAALMKAFLIHGAKDLGEKGPDYQTGWGLLDAKASLEALEKKHTFWVELEFQKPNQTKTILVSVNKPMDKLKATIVWVDPSANPSGVFALVHNFDAKFVSSSGQQHFPWVKDGSHPTHPATKQPNKVDNIEQVVVEKPAGEYQLEIKSPDSLLNQQKVAVVINTANAKLLQ